MIIKNYVKQEYITETKYLSIRRLIAFFGVQDQCDARRRMRVVAALVGRRRLSDQMCVRLARERTRRRRGGRVRSRADAAISRRCLVAMHAACRIEGRSCSGRHVAYGARGRAEM